MTTIKVPKVHIVVLNWNGKTDTLDCLASLQSVIYPDFDIVVVDNGSTDGSEDAVRLAFPEVTLIQAGENLGYAEGNNVGIRHAMECGADYVLVLNNDTIVDPNVVTALVAQAETNVNAAVLGPKILFYDDPAVINSAGGYINYESLERGHIGYGIRDDGSVHNTVSTVEWTTGCAMLLRVSALREVGLFDPAFFLVCEELDLCTRVRKRNYDILYVPEAKLWHKVSAAFDGTYSPAYCYYIFRNILLFAQKNFPDRRFQLYRALLKDSWRFYNSLSGTDLDYRRKGFCILMGTVHFFSGILGKAPQWVLKVPIPPKRKLKQSLRFDTPEMCRAEITSTERNLSGKAGTTISVHLSIKNSSSVTWPAFSATAVKISYHLRDQNGRTVVWDGLRTALPKDIRSGKVIDICAVLQLPEQCGTYLSEWDLVQETVAWFGAKGGDATQTISVN